MTYVDVSFALNEAAKHIEDPEIKACIQRLAVKHVDNSSAASKQREFSAELIRSAMKHWAPANGSNVSLRSHFRLMRQMIDYVDIVTDGTWMAKDAKRGVSTWWVSHRKFSFFKRRCEKLEAENAALKAAMAELLRKS